MLFKIFNIYRTDSQLITDEKAFNNLEKHVDSHAVKFMQNESTEYFNQQADQIMRETIKNLQSTKKLGLSIQSQNEFGKLQFSNFTKEGKIDPNQL